MVTHNIEEAVGMADRILVLGTDPGHIRVELQGLPLVDAADLLDNARLCSCADA
jgi:ABC-type nitrate/sulfonate/bicarbonate transport system ATPase subunit